MITVLHLRDSPFVGGPEKQILGQCARLDRSRFDPLVVSFTRTGSNALTKAAADLGIGWASVSDGKLALLPAVRQLSALTRRGGRCVVISSGFKADFTAALLCASRRIPWIVWFHGYTGVTPRVRLYESVDMLALRRARSTVAVCERAAGQLREAGLRPVVVVPNAVDVDSIASRGTRLEARNEFGLDDGDLVVGSAARLSIEKGFGCLIDAAGAILAAYPNVRFVLIGDGPLRAELERRVEQLGVAKHFIFAGLRAEAASLIKAMDVFVLPSLRENLPVALLEAMACGASVVATDVGGVREVLSGTGVKPIAPGSVDALAGAVIAGLANPGIGSASLVSRAREYSFDRQVRLMEAVIDQVEV
jgi:glycosyltransferase involved in cell wall biosynthesis